MNYRKLIFVICCFSFLFLVDCKDNIVDVSQSGKFNYTAYDSLGTVVAQGIISFEIQDTTNIVGEWEINGVGNPQKIGPQTGSGKLRGILTDGKLMIELNPDNRDNNVFLNGKLEGNEYTGKWYYSSFIGSTNWGIFVMKKLLG